MFKTLFAGAALSLCTLQATTAMAADASGNFAVRSFGGQTCSAVVSAINDSEGEARADIVSALSIWLGGYLSHANRTAEQQFDVSPFVADQDVLAIVVDRCEKAPDALFETAAHEIMVTLSAFGPKEMSPLADLQNAVALRVDTVVALQSSLIALGHLEGKADGVAGPATVAAVGKFNADAKIAGGDAITIETVLRLLGPVTAGGSGGN